MSVTTFEGESSFMCAATDRILVVYFSPPGARSQGSSRRCPTTTGASVGKKCSTTLAGHINSAPRPRLIRARTPAPQLTR